MDPRAVPRLGHRPRDGALDGPPPQLHRSWDALNYQPQYWQIRSRNGAEHYCGYPGTLDAVTPHTSGTDCIGPRWVDPMTNQETNGFVWKWASTTVMNYPGD